MKCSVLGFSVGKKLEQPYVLATKETNFKCLRLWQPNTAKARLFFSFCLDEYPKMKIVFVNVLQGVWDREGHFLTSRPFKHF